MLFYLFKTIKTYNQRLWAAHMPTNVSRDTFFILINCIHSEKCRKSPLPANLSAKKTKTQGKNPARLKSALNLKSDIVSHRESVPRTQNPAALLQKRKHLRTLNFCLRGIRIH